MPQITIDIDEEVHKIISKRAKKNLMTLREQIEDILRKSAVSTKNNVGNTLDKIDDTLVSVFSREKKGNYRRRQKKK